MNITKRFPIHPKYPERVCWGCDKYCAASQMDCGNGSTRTMHPVEIFGEDWADMLTEAENRRMQDAVRRSENPKAND